MESIYSSFHQLCEFTASYLPFSVFWKTLLLQLCSYLAPSYRLQIFQKLLHDDEDGYAATGQQVVPPERLDAASTNYQMLTTKGLDHSL